MNSKKVLALLLASIIILAGCSTPSNSSSEGSSSEVPSSSEGSSSETPSSSEATDSSSEGSSSDAENSDAPLTVDDIKTMLAEERANYTYNQELFDKIKGMHNGTVIPEDAVDVKIKTSMGEIELRLFPTEAPKAVENFITHAKNGYYDGVTFHRVIDGFMIQGGDPKGDGTGGESIWGSGFETEFAGNLFHFNGAISMANTGAPNTNGSQFFIVNSKDNSEDTLLTAEAYGWPFEVVDYYKEVGGAFSLDTLHPVFGYVTKGMDVVDAIAVVEKDANDKPTKDVIIEKIEVTEKK